MLLVTRGHHRVKHTVKEWLETNNYNCFEEVYAVDSEGSVRYADIVAFHPDHKSALILDLTIRYETNEPMQGEQVNEDKNRIYEKYRLVKRELH
ncbi:hypothetical protein O3M35_006606 [Rhynocoris fuscipes]|uniref:Uncharacterized protein n=1 Tax=Rhynocoris fuscipes TaxID=488301 RepID=A0AAW1DEN8_9HEMI